VSLSSCVLTVFLRFFFVVAISFSLHAMLPLLANKDEYALKVNTNSPVVYQADKPFLLKA